MYDFQQHKKNAYLIFLLAASFYLYEFVLQVAPGVMANDMMRTFHVDAAGFGIVSAFYFYAYAPMQLPAGVLFDRYGPRRLMTAAIILCAFGSFFFASTNSLLTAALGRFLIGVGSAFSFIGVLLLVSRWFPPAYFAFLAGIAQLMSSVGAMFGEMPLAKLIGFTGWRNASFILAVIGFGLAASMWVLIRDYPPGQEPPKEDKKVHILLEWRRLYAVCKHLYTWQTGLYACCIWTPIAVFAALWGVPYLEQKYGISVVEASGLCSMIWLGIGLGSPLLGWFSDLVKSRKFSLALSAFLGLTATLCVLYVPNISEAQMILVLFVLGLGAGGQTVSFAVVNDNNPRELVGTASGFNNLSVLIGGAVFQPLVGIFLRHGQDLENAQNLVQEGMGLYSIDNFNHALLVMPVCYAISLLVSLFWLQETHPEAKHHQRYFN